MRAADRDQLAQALRMARGELQADQRAVGVADEGVQRVDLQRVQQRRRWHRPGRRYRSARPACRRRRRSRRRGCGTSAGSSARPAATRPLAQPASGNCVAGGDVAMRGDAAGHEHHRRIRLRRRSRSARRTLRTPAWRIGSTQVDMRRARARGSTGRDAGAKRGRSAKRKGILRGAGACCVDEAHGGIPMREEAIAARGACRKSPKLGVCDAAVGQADRNHLPVDAQVPAGFGTATEHACKRCAPSGCPGFIGPVPQPVSMDGAQLASGFPGMSIALSDEAIYFLRPRRPSTGFHRPAAYFHDAEAPSSAAPSWPARRLRHAPPPARSPRRRPPRPRRAGRRRAGALRLGRRSRRRTRFAGHLADRGRPHLADRHRQVQPLAWSVFDAETGDAPAQRRRQGQGARRSSLRPNGIAVFGDRLFVAERDNHRVQVLSLPGFTPLGDVRRQTTCAAPTACGSTRPRRTNSKCTSPTASWTVQHYDEVPPLDRARPARAPLPPRTSTTTASFTTRDDGAFGDTSEAGALRMVESIAGDRGATTAC